MFIKLTSTSNSPVYLRTDRIDSVEMADLSTMVCVHGRVYFVQETMEEVLRSLGESDTEDLLKFMEDSAING